MKLKEFRKKMEKEIFTTREAQLVAFREKPTLVNLQLHQWKRAGDIVGLKRGLFMFADSPTPDQSQTARALYEPCYFSLQQVLSLYGVIPEAVFEHTLLTTKTTRSFVTPAGTFSFRKIKKEAFTGYDPQTLMASMEKALVDYFYFFGHSFEETDAFWESTRLEAGATNVNFKKVFRYASLFHSKKLMQRLHSFHAYAESHQIHPSREEK